MKRCAFLHDIGKALTHESEGSHAIVGADLPQLPACPQVRVQGLHRILENDADAAGAKPVELGLGAAEKRLSIELDAAADLRAPRQEAQDGHGRLCLTGARLADKANRFATLDENIDAVDNDILAVAYGQAGDIEQAHDDFLASK